MYRRERECVLFEDNNNINNRNIGNNKNIDKKKTKNRTTQHKLTVASFVMERDIVAAVV